MADDESCQSPEQPEKSITSPSIFSQLQFNFPLNFLKTPRIELPESLKHAPDTINLPQLPPSFLHKLQRIHGAARAQAGEYVLRSEVLIRDAVKEASEVLQDAVKILPPDIETRSTSSKVLNVREVRSPELETCNPDGDQHLYSTAATATRMRCINTLLSQLQHDFGIMLRDVAEDGLQETYSAWLASEYEPTGRDEWTSKITSLLDESETGDVLKVTRDALVPYSLDENEFWKRFFFRVHQIEVEGKRCRVLMQGTLDADEDFSWDDEDEEPFYDKEFNQLDFTTQLPQTPEVTFEDRESEKRYDALTPGKLNSEDSKLDPVVKDASDDDSDWE